MATFEIDWRDVDRKLRGIAQRRAALDSEEARWLREAERLQIWRPLGMVSALDYCERVLGYAPHTASERLRVARALGSLPLLDAALADGALNFSAVRELTRVATSSTEAAWRDAAIGKNVRQLEELVAGRAPGDRPDDPPDPDLRRHRVTLELSGAAYARWRQMQSVLASERGSHLDDDALATSLCDAVLDRGDADGEPTGRAKFQIMMTLCRRCEQGWQEGGGAQIAVDRQTVERARCDAQYIGATDDRLPVRAHQDVPPSVVRFVWRRDAGRCQTPGCRSARGLEIHHIVPRADGGSHDPSNLRLQCSACHQAVHAGTLKIVDGQAVRPNAPIDDGRPSEPRAAGLSRFENASPGTHVDGISSVTVDEAVHANAHTKAHANANANANANTNTNAYAHAHTTADAHAPSYVHAHTPPNMQGIAPVDEPRTIRAHVGRGARQMSSFDAAALRAQARDALTGLGWKPAIARTAVDEALSHLGPTAALAAVIREALRRCPLPTAAASIG